MTYTIRMGIPEMAELWNKLQTSYRDGTINKKDAELYKKCGSALKKLAMDPFYPSLKSHEIEPLSKRYGMNPIWKIRKADTTELHCLPSVRTKYRTWQIRPIRENLTGLLFCPNYK